MSMAIEHQDYFGAVATLAGALNLRYYNADEDYFEDFDPATYRWKIAIRCRTKSSAPIITDSCDCAPNGSWLPLSATAISIPCSPRPTRPTGCSRSDLQPGQLAIYANYGGRDNFNFDAQVESFAWLAATRGIAVTLDRDPKGTHSFRYLRDNMERTLLWLGQHILPPTQALRDRLGRLSHSGHRTQAACRFRARSATI